MNRGNHSYNHDSYYDEGTNNSEVYYSNWNNGYEGNDYWSRTPYEGNRNFNRRQGANFTKIGKRSRSNFNESQGNQEKGKEGGGSSKITKRKPEPDSPEETSTKTRPKRKVVFRKTSSPEPSSSSSQLDSSSSEGETEDDKQEDSQTFFIKYYKSKDKRTDLALYIGIVNTIQRMTKQMSRFDEDNPKWRTWGRPKGCKVLWPLLPQKEDLGLLSKGSTVNESFQQILHMYFSPLVNIFKFFPFNTLLYPILHPENGKDKQYFDLKILLVASMKNFLNQDLEYLPTFNQKRKEMITSSYQNTDSYIDNIFDQSFIPPEKITKKELYISKEGVLEYAGIVKVPTNSVKDFNETKTMTSLIVPSSAMHPGPIVEEVFPNGLPNFTVPPPSRECSIMCRSNIEKIKNGAKKNMRKKIHQFYMKNQLTVHKYAQLKKESNRAKGLCDLYEVQIAELIENRGALIELISPEIRKGNPFLLSDPRSAFQEIRAGTQPPSPPLSYELPNQGYYDISPPCMDYEDIKDTPDLLASAIIGTDLMLDSPLLQEFPVWNQTVPVMTSIEKEDG